MRAATAISDPVRREIVQMLHDRPAAAGAIARRFEISRPAVSRHLRVLRESGLVHDTVSGRQRIYTLDPEPLREIGNWIAQFTTGGWHQRFDALETEVARTRSDRRRARLADPAPPAGDQRAGTQPDVEETA